MRPSMNQQKLKAWKISEVFKSYEAVYVLNENVYARKKEGKDQNDGVRPVVNCIVKTVWQKTKRLSGLKSLRRPR